MPVKTFIFSLVVLLFLGTPLPASAKNLEVGPGRQFSRIEDAYREAGEGDIIAVYPQADNKPYEKVAIKVRKKRLTFWAVSSEAYPLVKVSGEDFDYSGIEGNPRAIFQFEKESHRCTLEGFELFGARNNDANASGVWIKEANNVTIRNCDIHHNDMGIMSIGDGTGRAAVNQRIENCVIHHNGSFLDPGYNHNLYLDGGSVALSFCNIYSSLTGHNVKSRAHFTLVQYCYVNYSSNREFDLVDSRETTRPGSNAVLMGNIIVKDPECEGNQGVINFGQDAKYGRNGTIYLIHNTIVTPFSRMPVLELSAEEAKAELIGNFICDNGMRQNIQTIAKARQPADIRNVTGKFNVFGPGFADAGGTNLSAADNTFRWPVEIPFVNSYKHDYRPAKPLPTGLPAGSIMIPEFPGLLLGVSGGPLEWQYRYPAGREKRPKEKRLTIGAYSAVK